MANRYRLRTDIFDYSVPSNECYCNVTKSCARKGVLDISSCSAGEFRRVCIDLSCLWKGYRVETYFYFVFSIVSVSGAPIVISRPHFLDSNANLDENGEPIIEGFHPDIAEHDFRIDIFPVSSSNKVIEKYDRRWKK